MLYLRVVGVIVLVIMLPGARCQKYTPMVGVENRSGPSSEITPAGPSQTWFTGSHPPGGNIVLATIPAIAGQRAAAGLPPLVWHDGLASVAKMHSDDMAARNYLNIIAPEGYDIFQSLVAANPTVRFDGAFAVVLKAPLNTPIMPTLLADPVASAAIMDPSYTHMALKGAGVPSTNTAWYALILARNARP